MLVVGFKFLDWKVFFLLRKFYVGKLGFYLKLRRDGLRRFSGDS